MSAMRGIVRCEVRRMGRIGRVWSKNDESRRSELRATAPLTWQELDDRMRAGLLRNGSAEHFQCRESAERSSDHDERT